MKTLLISILAAFLASGAFAQSASSGLVISIRGQQAIKVEVLKDRYGKPAYRQELQLDIEIVNTLADTNSFVLDVFFVGTRDEGMGPFRIVRKVNQYSLSLKSMGKREITSDSKARTGSESNVETNDFYPREYGYNAIQEGYIIRASAAGKPLKIVASSQALERLAKDPEKMAALESGKTVPLK